ncbi:hypothetical protein BDR04DRAFT_1214792, partial [Suillus decipiens]
MSARNTISVKGSKTAAVVTSKSAGHFGANSSKVTITHASKNHGINGKKDDKDEDDENEDDENDEENEEDEEEEEEEVVVVVVVVVVEEEEEEEEEVEESQPDGMRTSYEAAKEAGFKIVKANGNNDLLIQLADNEDDQLVQILTILHCTPKKQCSKYIKELLKREGGKKSGLGFTICQLSSWFPSSSGAHLTNIRKTVPIQEKIPEQLTSKLFTGTVASIIRQWRQEVKEWKEELKLKKVGEPYLRRPPMEDIELKKLKNGSPMSDLQEEV